MIYKEEERDLFSVPEDYYFVQCISADFGMGRGIALEFDKRFDMKNQMIKTYIGSRWTGEGYCLQVPGIPVLNLITKEKYWGKPTYNTIQDSLIDMRRYIRALKIKKIAMPKIGCGLDRLEWSKVSEIIKSIFDNENVEILVCHIG